SHLRKGEVKRPWRLLPNKKPGTAPPPRASDQPPAQSWEWATRGALLLLGPLPTPPAAVTDRTRHAHLHDPLDAIVQPRTSDWRWPSCSSTSLMYISSTSRLTTWTLRPSNGSRNGW